MTGLVYVFHPAWAGALYSETPSDSKQGERGKRLEPGPSDTIVAVLKAHLLVSEA